MSPGGHQLSGATHHTGAQLVAELEALEKEVEGLIEGAKKAYQGQAMEHDFAIDGVRGMRRSIPYVQKLIKGATE